MSVIICKRQFQRASAKRSYAGLSPTFDVLERPDSKWLYRVQTGDINDGPDVACRAAGLPSIGSAHPSVPGMICTDISADPLGDDGFNFLVTVEWGTQSSSGVTGGVTNPLSQPAIYTYGFAVSTEPVYIDKFGNPITNSAGETYDPPVEIEVYDAVVTVEKNIPSFDAGLAKYMVGGVNVATWYGCPPRTARINNVEASQEREDTVDYWKVRAEIQLREDTWDIWIIDQGYQEIRTVNGETKVYLILDDQGRPKNTPTLLDGSGGKLIPSVYDPQTGELLVTSDAPVFRRHRVRREVPFSLLGI